MTTNLREEIAAVLGISVSEISPTASFVELGGNSISAVALSGLCKSQGLSLSVESILTCSDLSKLWPKDLGQRSIPRKRHRAETEIIRDNGNDFLDRDDYKRARRLILPNIQKRNPNPQLTTPTNSSADGRAPIPHMHLSFIFGTQKQPGTNIIHYYETYPFEKLPIVKEAWKNVLKSEPIFRTRFCLDQGEAIMIEEDDLLFNWSEITVSNKDNFDEEVARFHISSDVESSFKVVVYRPENLHATRFTIIWRVHHCLMDGYSSTVVMKKVRQAMAGLPIRDGPSFLPLARRLDSFRKTNVAAGEEFWRQQQMIYKANIGTISLPYRQHTDKAHAPHTSLETFTRRDEVSKFARTSGVTEASIYYAAWGLVLSKYTGSCRVTMGAVLSGRNLPLEGVGDCVGSMINTLPFHVTILMEASVLEYLREIFQRLADLSAFQWTTPDDGYRRDFSTVVSIFLEGCPDPAISDTGLLERPFCQLATDVPIGVGIDGQGVISFKFPATYDRNDIDTMASIYKQALSAIIQPSRTVQTCLDSLFEPQRLRLLSMGNCFNSFTTTSSVGDNLVTLFEKSAAESPDAIAIEKGHTAVTYHELNRSACCIASYLNSLTETGSVVCVHADGSLNWIKAIYGVLKAKAVYCPIDRKLSASFRKSYYGIAQSSVFLVSSKSEASNFSNLPGTIISVEEILQMSASDPPPELKAQLRPPTNARANAYLCFTSGSTGKPKGVLCTHSGLVAFQKDLEVRLFAEPGRRIAQLMSPAFDGSIHEIFSTLSYGATLVLPNPPNLFDHLSSVDSAIMTPSLAKALDPSQYPNLKNIYLVGEAVSQALNDRWASECRLYNMYGPTEATCGATIKRLRVGEPVTIGRPNPSTRIYILSSGKKLLPQGVIGELYLAGVQVSSGYVGRLLETEERFMDDSICKYYGEKMYKTGDQGYWNGNGEIVLLGRSDRQVKLSGFRLDLDDIETRILEILPDATAVAITLSDSTLVGLIQSESLELTDVRPLLDSSLQSYAVPRRLAITTTMPLTHAGKVDYKAVANFNYSYQTTNTRDAMTLAEQKMGSIWRSVLDIPLDMAINRNSRFSELGGSSVATLLLSYRINAEFSRQVPLSVIMTTSTLAELTTVVEALQPFDAPITPHSRQASTFRNISPIECEWWMKYQSSAVGLSCFNVTYACFLGDTLDLSRFTSAWNETLARYRILRSRYVKRPGATVERHLGDHPPTVQQVRKIDIVKAANIPFELNQEPLIRIFVSPGKFLLVASHIICDLTAIKTLLSDVSLLYNGATLSSVKKEYWHTDRWTQEPSQKTIKFWLKYLENIPQSVFDIRIEKDLRTSYQGTSRVFKIPTSTFRAMTSFASGYGLSLHQLALAAVALTLSFKSGKTDIILGAPYLNRISSDDLDTVGLFLEPIPLRVRFDELENTSSNIDRKALSCDNDLTPFLHKVRESSRSALSNEISWSHLLKHLGIRPKYPKHPLIDVMVSFHEYKSALGFQGLDSTPLYTWTEGSKFGLMVEFQAIGPESLLLRLEYDDTNFSSIDIQVFQQLLGLSLKLLADGMGYAAVKQVLQQSAPAFATAKATDELKDIYASPITSI